jgi:hypothetical protein
VAFAHNFQARKFDTAAKWANVLTDEFSNQGVMEQELQIPSCLFGGPPVRDNLTKLGESQIGFMNIFARPLFEAVADILPSMHFAVDEILTNTAVWEDKIEGERVKLKKNPNLKLGLLSTSFAADPTPSPFSEGLTTVLATNNSSKWISVEENNRQDSNGSVPVGLPIPSSQPSSGAGLQETSQSRRGSGDASLTAILVTEKSNASDRPTKVGEQGSETRTTLPGERKDTLMKSSPKKSEGGKKSMRPVTAPSSNRRSQGKIPHLHNNSPFYRSSRLFEMDPDFDSAANLFPLPNTPSQSHSEVDLSLTANGNMDGPKSQRWDDNKTSGDSNISRSDASRDSNRRSEWWRQVSSRRRTRDVRNGEADARGQQKETMLDPAHSNATSDTTSPTMPSPGKSRTGKLKSFFKWKPKNNSDDEKHLSSFGSSSQLRTPPTSDPGHSANSDD